VPVPLPFFLIFGGCYEGGRVGTAVFPARRPILFPRSTQLLHLSSARLFSSRSYSDASLPASFSAGASLPTSVAERKPNTAWLHLLPARRSRIVNRCFLLPLSFSASAYSIFCWHFYLGYNLKR